MASPNLPAELRLRVDRRVDLPPDAALSLCQVVHHLAERDIPHDEQVDVAVVAQLVPRGRAEHKRHDDSIAQRPKGLAEDVGQTGGLHEQRLQLREYRRRTVGLEIHLPPICPAMDEARGD